MDVVVFDKTGTLTFGRPAVTGCHLVEGGQLSSAEQASAPQQ